MLETRLNPSEDDDVVQQLLLLSEDNDAPRPVDMQVVLKEAPLTPPRHKKSFWKHVLKMKRYKELEDDSGPETASLTEDDHSSMHSSPRLEPEQERNLAILTSSSSSDTSDAPPKWKRHAQKVQTKWKSLRRSRAFRVLRSRRSSSKATAKEDNVLVYVATTTGAVEAVYQCGNHELSTIQEVPTMESLLGCQFVEQQENTPKQQQQQRFTVPYNEWNSVPMMVNDWFCVPVQPQKKPKEKKNIKQGALLDQKQNTKRGLTREKKKNAARVETGGRQGLLSLSQKKYKCNPITPTDVTVKPHSTEHSFSKQALKSNQCNTPDDIQEEESSGFMLLNPYLPQGRVNQKILQTDNGNESESEDTLFQLKLSSSQEKDTIFELPSSDSEECSLFLTAPPETPETSRQKLLPAVVKVEAAAAPWPLAEAPSLTHNPSVVTQEAMLGAVLAASLGPTGVAHPSSGPAAAPPVPVEAATAATARPMTPLEIPDRRHISSRYVPYLDRLPTPEHRVMVQPQSFNYSDYEEDDEEDSLSSFDGGDVTDPPSPTLVVRKSALSLWNLCGNTGDIQWSMSEDSSTVASDFGLTHNTYPQSCHLG